jgi:hypothetical protein
VTAAAPTTPRRTTASWSGSTAGVTFFWGEAEVTITPKLGRDGTGQPARVRRVGPRRSRRRAGGTPQATTQLAGPLDHRHGTASADKDPKIFLDEAERPHDHARPLR